MRMQDVAGEGILLAGGAAAILLQVADPRVAAGVARQQRLRRERPLDRLHGTPRTSTCSRTARWDEQHRVALAVGAAHRPVPGAAGMRSLQRWVAATLYWTAARIHELVLDPVDDELYREYARIGTALGMPAALGRGRPRRVRRVLRVVPARGGGRRAARRPRPAAPRPRAVVDAAPPPDRAPRDRRSPPARRRARVRARVRPRSATPAPSPAPAAGTRASPAPSASLPMRRTLRAFRTSPSR